MLTVEIKVCGIPCATIWARRIRPAYSPFDQADCKCDYTVEVHELGVNKNCQAFEVKGHRYGDGAVALVRKILVAYQKVEAKR